MYPRFVSEVYFVLFTVLWTALLCPSEVRCAELHLKVSSTSNLPECCARKRFIAPCVAALDAGHQ